MKQWYNSNTPRNALCVVEVCIWKKENAWEIWGFKYPKMPQNEFQVGECSQ